MNWSWKIGRVMGTDLYLHPTFLLLLFYVGATQGGLLAMLLVSAVFGCVLLHELGHSYAARFYGICTEDITLYPIGGVARLTRMPRKGGPELIIALAGPLVNFAIAAALGLLVHGGLTLDPSWRAQSILPAFLGILATYNLLLASFNLVPAFPMDGGRVLRALLSGWMGRLRATEVAANLGRWLAIAFGCWALFTGNWLHVALAAFVYFAGSMELARVRSEEMPRRMPTPTPFPWRGYTPAGQRWVYMGNGSWRLSPIVVRTEDSGTSRSWA